MVPEPSVSNRSNASRISCFCSSVRPEERPLPLSRRAEPTACDGSRSRGGARGGVSGGFEARRAKKNKGARSNREKLSSTDVPVATGPLSGDRRNCAKFHCDERRGERSRATRVRLARANAVIDAVGCDSRRCARLFASRARARAVRRPPNIGQQRISRFKLQIEARGMRHRASAEGRARRGATARFTTERAPGRRIARRRNRARAVEARTSVVRVARARTRSSRTEIRDAGRLVCADPGNVARVPKRDARARVDHARGAAARPA